MCILSVLYVVVLMRNLHDFPAFSGHNYIGSEHLLLGLLREGEGVAARVLENLGADPSNIRTQARISSRQYQFSLFEANISTLT